MCILPCSTQPTRREPAGVLRRETRFRHQLPNHGLLHRDQDLFRCFQDEREQGSWRYLDKENGVAAAGALVQFGGCRGAVQTGRNKVGVEVRERWEGCLSEARDDDVFVFVFTDGQVLRTRWKKVQNLQELSSINFLHDVLTPWDLGSLLHNRILWIHTTGDPIPFHCRSRGTTFRQRTSIHPGLSRGYGQAGRPPALLWGLHRAVPDSPTWCESYLNSGDQKILIYPEIRPMYNN